MWKAEPRTAARMLLLDEGLSKSHLPRSLYMKCFLSQVVQRSGTSQGAE